MNKFCYNPYSKTFFDCGYNDHAITLYKAGEQKAFDQYIRGIILENVVYLRLYWPFSMDEGMTIDKLNKLSHDLLQAEKTAILQAVKENLNIVPGRIVYNADNEVFQALGIRYI